MKLTSSLSLSLFSPVFSLSPAQCFRQPYQFRQKFLTTTPCKGSRRRRLLPNVPAVHHPWVTPHWQRRPFTPGYFVLAPCHRTAPRVRVEVPDDLSLLSLQVCLILDAKQPSLRTHVCDKGLVEPSVGEKKHVADVFLLHHVSHLSPPGQHLFVVMYAQEERKLGLHMDIRYPTDVQAF